MAKETISAFIERLGIEEIKSSNLTAQAARLLNTSLSSLKKVEPIGAHGKRRPKREIRDILEQRKSQIIAVEDALDYLAGKGKPSPPIEFLIDPKDKKVLGFEIGTNNKGATT